MCDLSSGVNSGVRASCTADLDLLEKLTGRREQSSLNRLWRVRLRLPAGITRSFIFDREFVRAAIDHRT
jgi:hypothetical protein